MSNENINVEEQYKTMTILWFALLFSQIMFLVVLFFVKPEIYRLDFSKPLLGENAPVVLALAFLSVSTVAASFVLRKKFLAQAVSEQKTELVQTALIVGCALCEAASLFGLVAAFAFSYQYFFLFFALGIGGTILHFPKRENLIAASYKK